MTDGDAWEGIDAFAVEIHTQRTKATAKDFLKTRDTNSPSSNSRLTPRNATSKKLPEPTGRIIEPGGSNFVVRSSSLLRICITTCASNKTGF